MPRAASFYNNGHLTRNARRHLARLYLEAEQDNTLAARISRHQTKQRQHSPSSGKPGAVTDSEQHKQVTHDQVEQMSRMKPECHKNHVECKSEQTSTDTDLNFDAKIAEDNKKMHWGDRARTTPTSQKDPPRSKKDLNWGSIIHYEQRQYERTMKQLHQKSEEAKERYRQILFDQMNNHKQLEHQAELANLHEAEEEKKHQDLISQQNKKLAIEHHKQMEELKNSRYQQVKEREEHRKRELQAIKEMETRAAENIRRKLEADKAQAMAKRAENRKIQWDLIVENNREKAAKSALAEKELEENKRLQKVYEDLLDKQEKERIRALEIRHEKQRQHDAGYEDIRKHRQEILRKEEERIARDQQLIAEMQMNRDQVEAEIRQKALDENQAKILEQIQEKNKLREAEKQVELEYKKKLMEIANNDRHRAELIAAQANQEKRRLQEELQQQIKTLEEKRLLQKVEMTETERCLNQVILNKIAEELHLE